MGHGGWWGVWLALRLTETGSGQGWPSRGRDRASMRGSVHVQIMPELDGVVHYLEVMDKPDQQNYFLDT